MKRITQDYVGRPVAVKPRPDVMGRPLPAAEADVACFLDARGTAAGFEADSDDRFAREFAEFLSGNADPGAPFLAEPDPVFRERLRRRLWRLRLLARPKNSNDPH